MKPPTKNTGIIFIQISSNIFIFMLNIIKGTNKKDFFKNKLKFIRTVS